MCQTGHESSARLATVKSSSIQSNHQGRGFPSIQTRSNFNCRHTHTHFLCYPLFPKTHSGRRHVWAAALWPFKRASDSRSHLHRQRRSETEMTAAKQSWANNTAWLPDLWFHSPSGETMLSLFSPGSSHHTPVCPRHTVTSVFALQ